VAAAASAEVSAATARPPWQPGEQMTAAMAGSNQASAEKGRSTTSGSNTGGSASSAQLDAYLAARFAAGVCYLLEAHRAAMHALVLLQADKTLPLQPTGIFAETDTAAALIWSACMLQSSARETYMFGCWLYVRCNQLLQQDSAAAKRLQKLWLAAGSTPSLGQVLMCVCCWWVSSQQGSSGPTQEQLEQQLGLRAGQLQKLLQLVKGGAEAAGCMRMFVPSVRAAPAGPGSTAAGGRFLEWCSRAAGAAQQAHCRWSQYCVRGSA
jgi:hypothetical protein